MQELHIKLVNWQRQNSPTDYELSAYGKRFSPISIAKENRLEYFNTLEAYAVEGNLTPFSDMLAELTEQQLNCYLAMMKQGL